METEVLARVRGVNVKKGELKILGSNINCEQTPYKVGRRPGENRGNQLDARSTEPVTVATLE